MNAPYVYRCARCDHIESVDVPFWCCPICRGQWSIYSDYYPDNLPVETERTGLWRYFHAIPVPGNAEIVSLGEPNTALTTHTIRGIDCMLKHEYQLPSGSFKDRGASVVITMAKHLGLDKVIIDSSGNAAAAVAAYSAGAGITCRVFIPSSTSTAKMRQIASYGAVTERIPGTREEAASAAEVAAEAGTEFYASHYRHPLFIHGVKTMAFEIWEQLGRNVPGTVVVPVGNGSLILGLITGFRELLSRRMAVEMPRFIGVQAANCAPVTDRFQHRKVSNQYSSTLAEGIAVARPFLGEAIVRAVNDTDGDMLTVSESAITDAWEWAWKQGLCIEKTSAVAIAGIAEASLQSVELRPPVISVLTGHGLKG